MAVNFLKGNKDGATVGDKIRGVIAIALTITCFSVAANTTDQQWQAACMVAGFLYMLTSIAIVFKDMDE